MNNGRFAVSLHILTLLEKLSGNLVSSELIADSININPVLVRKEMSNLRKHGLITTKEGKNGGSSLAKPARQILLSEVYETVRQLPILGQSRNMPNPNCPVGKQINLHLDTLYQEAETALLQRLSKLTLADFANQFK